MSRILPVVEGDGDVKAVPILVRRILHEHGLYDVDLLPAQKRGDFPKVRGAFDNYFNAALKWNAPILWVMDFDCEDCECVAQESLALYRHASRIRPGWPFKVVFVPKEFETLFLLEQQAARDVLGIAQDYQFPDSPELIRGAKQVLSKALPSGRAYKEMVHQEKIAARLEMAMLRSVSPCFRHMENSIIFLVHTALPE